MFVSTYHNGLDKKGRVSVPAPFRAALREAPGVYCWRSFEGPFLEGGGEQLMRHYAEALAQLPPFDPSREALANAIFGGAFFLAFDQTGRVSLPDELRAHARLEDKAVFVGLIERFQIMDPVRYDQRQATLMARANQDKHLLGSGLQTMLRTGLAAGDAKTQIAADPLKRVGEA